MIIVYALMKVIMIDDILYSMLINANHQEYYSKFYTYRSNAQVHLEVYKFLKTHDLTSFNPMKILETEEKAKYPMKAIPFPIQFVQYHKE